MSAPSRSLLDLPNELLMMIKDALGPYELLGIVCYYLLCKRTSALYDKFTTADWMRLVRANGLSIGTYEKRGDAAYKTIAIECARHAWTCTHPQCGRTRLEENRRCMEDGMAAWPSLDYTDTIKSPHFDIPPDEGPILGSTVFSAIAFKTPPRGRLVDPYKEQLAYLRPVDQDLQQTPPAESLEAHPVALRTFASFPPIEAMHVDSPFDIVLMQNKRGLVAKDVCLYLCMHLEQKVYSDSLSESLRQLGRSVPEAFPWDLPTLERSVRQLQDWFKVVYAWFS